MSDFSIFCQRFTSLIVANKRRLQKPTDEFQQIYKAEEGVILDEGICVFRG
jgi:hypothetical protein